MCVTCGHRHITGHGKFLSTSYLFVCFTFLNILLISLPINCGGNWPYWVLWRMPEKSRDSSPELTWKLPPGWGWGSDTNYLRSALDVLCRPQPLLMDRSGAILTIVSLRFILRPRPVTFMSSWLIFHPVCELSQFRNILNFVHKSCCSSS